MSIPDTGSNPPATAQGYFTSTHWSDVLAAAQTESAEAGEALANLCQTYWYPLYAFVRRKGIGPHEAEDLTQDFFAARVVTRLIFHGVASGRGKFRTWLLNCFQNFLHNEWDKRQAKKRGGGHAHVPLDLEGAETRYSLEPAHNETPERCYERTWLLTLLDHALTALENRFKQADQAALFNELKGFLPGVATPPSFAEVAERLGKSEAAVKMAVSRFKREYGEVLTLEIRRTVSNLEEFNDELRHLITVVSD